MLSALAEDDQQIGNRIAEELGLAYVLKSSEASVIRQGWSTVESDPVLVDNDLKRSLTAQLTTRYLQLVRYTPLQLDTEKQEKKRTRKKTARLGPAYWQNRPKEAPKHSALTTLKDLRTRLFPWLALDCQGGRSIDFAAIIDKISKAEFPASLPTSPHKQGLNALQIIDDRQVHLIPFWSDHSWLTLHLYDTFEAGQISRAVITNGDIEPRRISRDCTLQPFRLPPAGTPILFLSDLGRLSQQGSNVPRNFNRRQQQYWQLIRRLIRNGNPVTVLSPCSPLDYPGLLRQQIRCFSWEPLAQILPTGSEEDSEKLRQGVENMLTLAAPAIRLEPELLRSLRTGMSHFGTQLPAAVESLCWQHPDIKEPHPVAATFSAQARKERIQKFIALSPEQQRFALDLLRQWRQPLSDEIWFEELLNIETLLDKKAVFQGDALKEVEQDIQAGCDFLGQLIEQGKLNEPDYHAWAIRLDKRISTVAVQQGTASVQFQHIFQQTNPGQSTSRSSHVLDPELLPTENQPEKKAWLCQQGKRLVITQHVPTQVPQQNTSMIAALSYRRPEMKLVLDDGRSCSLELPANLTETIEPLTGADDISLLEISCIKTDLTELHLQAVEKPAWASAMGRDCFGLYADLTIPHQEDKEVAQRFRWISSGTFMMGSPPDERSGDDDYYHRVILTKGYWLADTAVTQAMWQVLTGKNPATFTDNKQNPVEQVSWDDTQKFIAKLNQHVNEDGGSEKDMFFRLPSEAEWEHACRAGTDTPFFFGENITSKQVNYKGTYPYADGEKERYREKTVPVKSLPPNPWGLYEMHGNVWDWCADAWPGKLDEQPVIDPYHNASYSSNRVQRGGSWLSDARYVRSAYRNPFSQEQHGSNDGFRLALGHELTPQSQNIFDWNDLKKPIKIFASYSRNDFSLLQQITAQLAWPISQKHITIWSGDQIGAGQRWEEQINQHLNHASIILLLLSPDFFASKWCRKEMDIALERAKINDALVIPVYLRMLPQYILAESGLATLQAALDFKSPLVSARNQIIPDEKAVKVTERVIEAIEKYWHHFNKTDQVEKKIRYEEVSQKISKEKKKHYSISKEPVTINTLNQLLNLSLETLNFYQAKRYAERLGGRLPTAEEWQFCYQTKKILIFPEAQEWLHEKDSNEDAIGELMKIEEVAGRLKTFTMHQRIEEGRTNYAFRIVRENLE